MFFSLIIPVFNRPEEIDELLKSLVELQYKKSFEIVIVEDGSTINCEEIVKKFQEKLNISYYFKTNSGPGDSRNYGMKMAQGDYFIIFDSDCIIPNNYLDEVEIELETEFVDCFGGPDTALKSFSNIQKAINFSMTSFLTTGGIRGGSESISKFQPRSFNMGISQKAFQESNGFGNIHPGEDPDLSIRLWNLGFKTRLFPKAFVYHKRRIDWEKFSVQVSKFGKARPILNYWYPEYSKITFWFPTLFVTGFYFSIICLFVLFDIPLKIYFAYFIIIFLFSTYQNKSISIGFLSLIAVWKQFFGYGLGFLESFVKIQILKKKPEVAFPELFFMNQIESIEINEFKELSQHIKTKIIGLTGGIGSGKTTVANYIKSLGIPVYISDLEAKKVMEFPKIITKIEAIFGNEVVLGTSLNREKLASIVFKEPEKLKQLNALVHPEVKMHFDRWVSINKKEPFVVKEAAILFESGSYKDCDLILTVVAPIETRIERVLKRDNTSREKVLNRINNQLSDNQRIERSDFVIQNENLEDMKMQVLEIIKTLSIK
ncbi:MAG: dephospho-CoA kinase [Flavobacterium sp.]|nr:dephospho-CoA kinase [Flavobacterium sp.]